MRVFPAVALAVATMLAGTGIALAQTVTPTPAPTPTATAVPTPTPVVLPTLIPNGQVPIAQLCAATGVDQVDTLLGQVSNNALTDQLKPLAGIAVPKADALTLVDAAQLADVRKRLNCPDVTTTTAAPTTTASAPPFYDTCAALLAARHMPLLATAPGYRAGLDTNNDGLACDAGDLGVTAPVLSGGVNTGDGSTP